MIRDIAELRGTSCSTCLIIVKIIRSVSWTIDRRRD